jgi:hypothetical protein
VQTRSLTAVVAVQIVILLFGCPIIRGCLDRGLSHVSRNRVDILADIGEAGNILSGLVGGVLEFALISRGLSELGQLVVPFLKFQYHHFYD